MSRSFGAMDQPHELKVADGRVLQTVGNTCPVRLLIHPAWGPVLLDQISFTVMPGDDDLVIVGNHTFKMLGVDIHDCMGEHARVGRETKIMALIRRTFVRVVGWK